MEKTISEGAQQVWIEGGRELRGSHKFISQWGSNHTVSWKLSIMFFIVATNHSLASMTSLLIFSQFSEIVVLIQNC